MQVYRNDEISKHQVLMDFLSQNEGEPTKFIRELKDKSSILVFYEEQKYAKSLGFLFVDIGLRVGQTCLYLSCETTPSIKADMVSGGINVAHFKTNNLRIHSTTNQKRDQITKTIEDFVRDDKKLRVTNHNSPR